ncbi:MAG: ABC transporter permease [Rhizobiaceae bacterium]
MTASQNHEAERLSRQVWIENGERYALILVWIAVIVFFGILRPDTFLAWPTFSTIFGSQAVLVVLTLGLIIPLTAGDYDLSIASVMTMSSMLLAVFNVWLGWPLWLAVAAALGAGLLVGILNATIVLYFRLQSLIVTLGMGTFINGITLWFSSSKIISGVDFSLVIGVIGTRLFGIPLAFYYALLVALIIWYVFSYTAIGQRLLFVGRGREVARLSGIRVDRVRFGAMVISSGLGALAGVLYVGTTGAADPVSGLSYLLPAFAAAFLGATSIQPGRFNAIGSVIAVYFLVTGITGLSILGMATFVQNLFYGGALVIAVCLSQLVRGREERLT